MLTSADEDFEARLLCLDILRAEFKQWRDEYHGFC